MYLALFVRVPANLYLTRYSVLDSDGDGLKDLVTANYGSDDIGVRLGLGGGSFGPSTRFPAGDGPTSISYGDLNQDGRTDIVTGNRESVDVSVLLGLGDGSFELPRDYDANFSGLGNQSLRSAVEVVDLDLDGAPEILFALEAGQQTNRKMTIFWNQLLR